MEFEWDDEKYVENLRKHKVSFFESLETFQDPNGFKMIDVKYSTSKEQRFYWIGKSKSERILTTRFTMRDKKIRIIGSAEWRKFRKLYEATKIK